MTPVETKNTKSSGIIVVIDGNEPDTQQGENLLHVFAHADIITAKTGKVFHDDGINLAIAHTMSNSKLSRCSSK